LDDVSSAVSHYGVILNDFINFRTNIPKGDISKGEQIVPYLQPIPFKGTGYHRYVFILYKQDKKLDFSEFKVSDDKDLEKRTFYTFDFYKKYQDFMTPAGLSFFQTKWDESVGDLLHNQFSKHNISTLKFIN
jgi:large subunit ribosomal protein L38